MSSEIFDICEIREGDLNFPEKFPHFTSKVYFKPAHASDRDYYHVYVGCKSFLAA